ncbi:MAG: Fic family protein [Acidimicrobiaceae bacterium]|nr:Fic family protein [Acidimicrobiaceae bacterium]
MIYQPPALTTLDEQVLDEIRGCHDGLQTYLFRPRRWYKTLSRVMMARAVHASTSIEGYHSTVAETAAVLDGEDVPHLDEDTPRAIAAYRDAMTYVLSLTDDDEPQPAMDASLLRSLHYMMMADDLSKRPGKWRKGAVWVRNNEGAVVYTAPHRDELEGLIAELVHQVNDTGMNPLIRAAMAHLNLTLLHPFEDGNGRLARCLQSFVLAQDTRHPHFMSIEEDLGLRTSEYYRALQDTAAGRWSPARSTRPWIEWCLTAHLRQAHRTRWRLDWTEALWSACDELARAHGLADRTVGPLMDAAYGRSLGRSTYIHIVQQSEGDPLSEISASRDLSAMVGADLLEPTGAGRGRRYKASQQLRQLRQEMQQAFPRAPDPEPYAGLSTA